MRRRRLFQSSGTAFDPLDLSGLHAWWDFSDATKIYTDSSRTTLVSADADPIGGYEDKSGNGKHLSQATAGRRPTYKLNRQNGKSGAFIDGSDDYLQSVALSALSDLTIFVVAKRIGAPGTGTGTMLPLGGTSYTVAGTDYLQWYHPDTAGGDGVGKLNFDVAGLDIDSLAVMGTSANVWSILNDNIANATDKLFRDGVEQGTGTGNESTAATAGFVGSWNNGVFNGDLYEVIIYDSALSTANRQSVEGYLKSKWGTP